MYVFRWNDWNTEHIGEHGIAYWEAEYLINHARKPFPQRQGDNRFLVMGQLPDGVYPQAGFIFSPPGVVFVIHARPLMDIEKRRLRRRRHL